MRKFDYILPAIVGVILLVSALQLMHTLTSFNDGGDSLIYGAVMMIFSLLCIFIAINEYKNHH
jgi:uncharacterized YccA/Bax inhibitor family protein